MDKSQFVQLLMATFVAELDERMQALNHDLLALEKQPHGELRAELLKTLFRSAHSMKGAARSVNLVPIETACHWLEEALTAVRDGRLPLDAPLFAVLFSAVDAIQDAGKRVRAHADLSGSPLAALLPRLEQALATELTNIPIRSVSPSAVVTPRAAPSPSPLDSGSAPTQTAYEATQPAVEETQTRVAPKFSDDAAAKDSFSAAPPPTMATVRVSAEKLDTLLAQCGELLVARRRIESRAAELQLLQEEVASWTAKWRAVDVPLKHLLETTNDAESINGESESAFHLPPQVATLLRETGERLRRLEKDLDRLNREMALDHLLLSQSAGGLEDEVHRARLLPFAEGCLGLDRAVRDLASATGKQVDFMLEGEDVEVDRSILEGIKDPLLHLVRNAVDHGIEDPERRRAAGKNPVGQVKISASLRGSQVEVAVSDDGAGLDLSGIREHARRKNIPAPQEEHELWRLLFRPGFSTSPIITDVSGRGVGLDVVKSRLESLHGSVEVVSDPGRGTSFILTVPLTLTTVPALLVRAGGHTLAFVSTQVDRVVRFRPDAVQHVAGREVLMLGGAPIPLSRLATALGLSEYETASPPAVTLAVIVVVNKTQIAFVVDEVLDEQVIVVKSLGSRLRRVPCVTGTTLLASGHVALLLNAANLAQAAGRRTNSAAAVPANQPVDSKLPRLLVVEDSLTTRSLMKSILEANGYDVTVAVDGEDAWDRLQKEPFRLVISDVEMPRMDGFALTEAIRNSTQFQELPVVLVTAREAEADKVRGISVGASAYLVKSGFDQSSLLETISQLL